MTNNPPAITCPYVIGENNVGGTENHSRLVKGTPLTRTCGCEKVKICKINGDRKMCARMAQMGFMPGSEIELICPGHNKSCMVRVKGATVTLDELQAEHILVTPA